MVFIAFRRPPHFRRLTRFGGSFDMLSPLSSLPFGVHPTSDKTTSTQKPTDQIESSLPFGVHPTSDLSLKVGYTMRQSPSLHCLSASTPLPTFQTAEKELQNAQGLHCLSASTPLPTTDCLVPHIILGAKSSLPFGVHPTSDFCRVQSIKQSISSRLHCLSASTPLPTELDRPGSRSSIAEVFIAFRRPPHFRPHLEGNH